VPAAPGRLARLAVKVPYLSKGLSFAGKGLGKALPPVLLGAAGTGFARGLYDPQHFEAQTQGPEHQGPLGSTLANAQDLLYRDWAGWHNVPGRAGAMVRRAAEAPFTMTEGRDLPVQFEGKSALNPRSESLLKRTSQAALARMLPQLGLAGLAASGGSSGLGSWFKANTQSMRDWWQQRQSPASDIEEALAQPAVVPGQE
jgi:hypothetical protein